MTEQDTRRLQAVADLYADVDEAGAARLRESLARAKVCHASKLPREVVSMSSRVALRDAAGSEREVSLVYPWDAHGARVSVLSACGGALLGASIGGAVEHEGRAMIVASIPYQPEAAGDHHL